MIVATKLISQVFIIMFICFLIFELITMGSFILLNQSPLKKNTENIEAISLDNAFEIATSFSQLLNSTIANIKTDLLLFVKHTEIYYLNIGQEMPELNKKSLFYKTYGNCLYYSKTFPNSFQDYDSLLKQLKLNENTKTHALIDELISNLMMSSAYYYTEDGESTPFSKDKEHFICYAISFLKSIMIRNTVMEHYNQIILNFTMLLRNDLVFYPTSKLDFNQIMELPHYNSVNSSCKVSYHFYCLNNSFITHEFPGNSIYSFSPILKDNSIITNICINFKIPNFDPDKDKYKQVLCTTVNISQIISNVSISSENILLSLVKKDDNQGIELLYSSSMDMNDLVEIFDNYYYDTYRIQSSKDKLSLFHSFYYKLGKIAKLSDHEIMDIVSEYKGNIAKIEETISNLGKNNSENIQGIQTFIQYTRDSNTNEITGYSHQPELFDYYITRIIFKNNKYKYIKDGDDYKDKYGIMFDMDSEEYNSLYLVISLKIGNNTNLNKVYSILILKTLKSLVSTLSLIFLEAIIFFVVFQYIITLLLYPLLKFKDVINSIVDRKKEIERAKAGTLINEEKIKIVFNENTMKEEYTNREVQLIGKLIIFLNQIINLKDSKTTYNKRAKLYSSISEYIENHKIEKLQSQIIVAKYYIKEQEFNYDSNNDEDNTDNERDYQKAIDLLENMQKPLEDKENEIISQNDDIEQKSNSLSTMKSIYINEYNQEQIFPNDPWISLQFIKENYHFVLGQAYYYSFYSLYKNNKTKSDNFLYKDQYENQKALVLSQAINHFKKACRINDHLQINSIKNIIIFLYLSKCYYHYQNENQKTDASKMLKKSIVCLAKFFKMIRELTEDTKSPKFFVDPRIMLIISGILMEDILYSIGDFAKKLNKNKTAFEFLTKMFSVSYYKNQTIHQKTIHILEKILRTSNQQKNIIYKKLIKLQTRLSATPKQKTVFIIISENFTENYSSLESFRLLIKNCLLKYLDEKDLVGYIFLSKYAHNKNQELLFNIPLQEKEKAILAIDGRISGISPERNSSSMVHINLGDAFEKVSRVCKDQESDKINLYFFAFAKMKDMRFSSDKNAKKFFEDFYYKNASIYIYCFDKQIPKDKINHYKKFFSHFSEGIMVLVKNFKMIKLGFENMANLRKSNNLLSIDYSNTNNLLY